MENFAGKHPFLDLSPSDIIIIIICHGKVYKQREMLSRIHHKILDYGTEYGDKKSK